MREPEPMPSVEEMLEPTPRGISLLARHALGMNYWLDEKGKEYTQKRTSYDGKTYYDCGIVCWGPHGQMLTALSNVCHRHSEKHLLLMTSRGGLKTSAVQATIMQMLLSDPNHCIMVYMATYSEALKTIGAVKRWFESERVKDLFGDRVPKRGRGKKESDTGFKWADDQLFLANRTNISDRNPNLFGGGLDRNITGGHAHTIFVDDPVNWQQVRSVEQMEKAKSAHGQLRYILNPGGRFVITMTPYDESDLSHHVRDKMGELYDQVILDCGMEAVQESGKKIVLAGEPRFPHHSRKFLEQCLQESNDVADFQAQYALKITNPADQIFFRDQFEEVKWDDRFKQMSCYVLCDTAVTDKEYSCYSVAMLVALDHEDVAYCLDGIVGRWDPDDFANELMLFLAEWQSKVRIVGVSMEKGSINHVYGAFLKKEAQDRNLRLNLIPVPRSSQAADKNRRIRSLTTRFQAGHFKVVNTMSREFNDRGEQKTLWDPKGFRNDEGHLMPDGELVMEFVRFRSSGGEQTRIDICDALADLQATDAAGRRVISPSPRPWNKSGHDLLGYARSPADRERLKAAMDRQSIIGNRPRQNDFWSRMARRARKSV